MADNRTKQAGQDDRKRINTSEDHKVRDWSAKFGVTKAQLLAAVKAGRRRRGIPEEGQEVGSRPVEPTSHPMTGRGLTLPARLPGKTAIRRADSRPSAPASAQNRGWRRQVPVSMPGWDRTQLLSRVVLRSDRQMSHQFPSSNLSTREGTGSAIIRPLRR